MKKKIIMGLVILALGIGGYIYNSTQAADVVEEQTTTLEPITTGYIQKTIFSDGIVSAKGTETIYSEYASSFSVINFKEGDQVKKGDIIAQLDLSDLEKSLKTAEYTLQLDQKSLNDLITQSNSVAVANYNKTLNAYNQALTDLKNNQSLYDAGVVTLQALKSSQLSLDNAYVSHVNAKETLDNLDNSEEISALETKIQIDQMEIDNILANIDAATIYSPIDGIIVTAYSDINRSFNNGEQLFVIEDLSALAVEATISEYDINYVEIGQSVKIDLLGEDKSYEGKVVYIAPKANGGSSDVVVPITIDITNVDENIKANFTANIEIIVASNDNALQVPYESLIDTAEGTVITISRNGEEIQIPVEKGIISNMYVEIISNEILDGDQIVVPINSNQSNESNSGGFPGMGGGKDDD